MRPHRPQLAVVAMAAVPAMAVLAMAVPAMAVVATAGAMARAVGNHAAVSKGMPKAITKVAVHAVFAAAVRRQVIQAARATPVVPAIQAVLRALVLAMATWGCSERSLERGEGVLGIHLS